MLTDEKLRKFQGGGEGLMVRKEKGREWKKNITEAVIETWVRDEAECTFVSYTWAQQAQLSNKIEKIKGLWERPFNILAMRLVYTCLSVVISNW